MVNVVNKGNHRSTMVKRNVLASIFIKGIDAIVYFLLVPLTLGYLNPYEYGIWLTLSSILTWIDSLDVGLGNGLRNKLGEALAIDDIERGRSYVSTTFFMLMIIASSIFLISTFAIFFVDWYSVLNVDVNVVNNLREVVFYSFLFYCIGFIFKFVGNVYQAKQLPLVSTLMVLGAHVFSLTLICILKYTVPGTLLSVAVIYSSAMPIIYIVCYSLTFLKLYPELRPSYRFFQKEKFNDLFRLSSQFFVLQIMAVVVFGISNVVISNIFGPNQVTPYNIANKYLGALFLFWGFLSSPLWSAITDAYAKKDFKWIELCVKKMKRILAYAALVIIIMLTCSDFVYKIWIGDSVQIPFSMSLFTGIYVYILLESTTFSSILNGMGKLRLQTINIIVAAVLFYPMCLLLSRLWGVNGIIISMCVVNLPSALSNYIQVRMILNHSAKGIWDK